MTPNDMADVIKIATSRMRKCGIPVPTRLEMDAHITRIMWQHTGVTKYAVANKIVELCRKDYTALCARYSEKIEGTQKRKTVRLHGIMWDDYLSAMDIHMEVQP